MIDLSMLFTQGERWLYQQLELVRQDNFPDDFRLIIHYTSDKFDNAESPGRAISKLQEIMVMLDFPNFFVVIETSHQGIESDLCKIRDLYCPHDSVIAHRLISGSFKKSITTQDSICILPWIHLYVNPQGSVGTCCLFNEKYPLGNIEEQPLDSIVNSDAMKKVRRQMISGQRPDICSVCWYKEDSQLPSARISANQRFSHHKNLVSLTKPDGEFSEFKLRHLDFRASNICNLK